LAKYFANKLQPKKKATENISERQQGKVTEVATRSGGEGGKKQNWQQRSSCNNQPREVMLGVTVTVLHFQEKYVINEIKKNAGQF